MARNGYFPPMGDAKGGKALDVLVGWWLALAGASSPR